VHDYLQEMYREVLSKFPNYFTVGESPGTHDPADLLLYVLPERKELQMMFQFELADIDGTITHPLVPRIPSLPEIKAVINKWQTYMFEHGGWNSLYMENHDQARSVSRLLGFGANRAKKEFDFKLYDEDVKKHWNVGAKLLALLHATQGGTVFIYQGEEIGMINVPRSWGIEEYKDVATNNFYEEELEKRKKDGDKSPDMSDILDGINRKARDNARVPVQWDDSPHAGFTTGNNPWMRVNDNYTWINVKSQVDNEGSILSFWKKMVQMRKDYPVMVSYFVTFYQRLMYMCGVQVHGNFTLLSEEDESVFAYTREHQGAKALIVMNFTREELKYAVPGELANKSVRSIAGNVKIDVEASILGEKVVLGPFQGVVWLLS